MIRIDDWLAKPDVRSHHRRASHAPPEALWEQASALKLSDTRTLGRLVRWRIPETPRELTFRDVLSRYPFTVLAEGERWSVSGLCGRIWTLRPDYPRIADSDEFLAWNEPRTVRVLFASWVQEGADGRFELCNEARVKATDRGGAWQLRLLWGAIGRFEGLIGSEAVGQAVRRAEHASAAG